MRARNYSTVPEREAFYERLASERRAGETLKAIGARYGISAQRVSGCLKQRRIMRATIPCSGHTKCPEGYLAWHAWAERKSKTHRQIRCPDCGLFAIWIRRGRSTTPPAARPSSE